MSDLETIPTEPNPIRKVILYYPPINMKLRNASHSSILIKVFLPDILRSRITNAINRLQNSAFISLTELQSQLHNVLESFIRDFALLRDVANDIANGNRVEFICIGLNQEVISLIQTVYPPCDGISYNVIYSDDDAMINDYFEILPSPSLETSSAANLLNSLTPAITDKISTIPLQNGKCIYLGNDCGANDFAKLTALGITHILNASDCIPNYFEDTSTITYMRIPIADCGSVILNDYFPAVFKFINNALDTGGRILVHCFAGKSRSASFVIAYLMQYQRMRANDAITYIKTYRAIVEPNFGFRYQLIAFEKTLALDQN